MAGYGVGLAVKDIYATSFGERNFSSELMDMMVQNGQHGILLKVILLIQILFSIYYRMEQDEQYMNSHFAYTLCIRIQFSMLYFTGKSNGKGYYIYMKGEKPKPDPSVQHVIEEYRKRAKIMPGGKVLLSQSTCQKHEL